MVLQDQVCDKISKIVEFMIYSFCTIFAFLTYCVPPLHQRYIHYYRVAHYYCKTSTNNSLPGKIHSYERSFKNTRIFFLFIFFVSYYSHLFSQGCPISIYLRSLQIQNIQSNCKVLFRTTISFLLLESCLLFLLLLF